MRIQQFMHVTKAYFLYAFSEAYAGTSEKNRAARSNFSAEPDIGDREYMTTGIAVCRLNIGQQTVGLGVGIAVEVAATNIN